MLSVSNAERLDQAFMTSRLDYRNALLAWCPALSVPVKQALSGSKVATGLYKSDDISPILSSLH